MTTKHFGHAPPFTALTTVLALTAALVGSALADGSVSLGNGPGRNMAAPASNLPTTFDPRSGTNVLWVVDLGTETYAGPVAADGRVFIGTNNGKPRDPKVEGDHGVLMAFQADDGTFLWQRTHAKLASGRINDWPLQGVCTTPTVEGDRLYYVSSRGELQSVDTKDGSTVWSLDLIGKLNVFPHHMSVSSPLIVGDRLFVNTSHGVGEDGKVPNPEAPSFLAVDKTTGEVIWHDASPGAGILDGQWSSPSLRDHAGTRQVVFPAGDGWLYAFDVDGKAQWRFDANSFRTLADGSDSSTPPPENLIAPAVVVGGRVLIGVGHDPEMGAGQGHLWALEPAGKGDVTPSAVKWSYRDRGFAGTLGAVAVKNGRLYVTDLNGFLHCLDAETGKLLWKHDTFATVWAPPLVADGKVYVVDEDGDVAVLAEGPGEKVLAEINLGNSIYAPPSARDGVLYIATRSRLFALGTPPDTPREPQP